MSTVLSRFSSNSKALGKDERKKGGGETRESEEQGKEGERGREEGRERGEGREREEGCVCVHVIERKKESGREGER